MLVAVCAEGSAVTAVGAHAAAGERVLLSCIATVWHVLVRATKHEVATRWRPLDVQAGRQPGMQLLQVLLCLRRVLLKYQPQLFSHRLQAWLASRCCQQC